MTSVNTSTSKPQLNDDEKRTLYRDGYVILRNVIPAGMVEAARERIENAAKGELLTKDPLMTGLVNDTDITPILHEVMGQFDPPVACQVGVNRVRAPGEHFNSLGYRDRDMPYFGAESHVDGSMTIAIPQEVQTGSPDEVYARYIASGPKGDLGRSPDVMGHNMVPMFEDPDMTLGLGSFTAFVFVCLNDQMQAGGGQTALLPGAHHAVEQFFQQQYEDNGHVGVEGPGWPRLDTTVPNGCGLVYLPEAIRQQFVDDTCETTPDGRRWPRPTQILMAPGDACITVYQMPHSGTRNEFGTESRKNIIFRLRNKKRQPDKRVNGISDHPDRGQFGQWLEYEPGNDPWERSKFAMCNMWHEWDGMQEIVADMRGQ